MLPAETPNKAVTMGIIWLHLRKLKQHFQMTQQFHSQKCDLEVLLLHIWSQKYHSHEVTLETTREPVIKMYYSSPFIRAWHDHLSWSTATGDLEEPCLTNKGLEEVEWYSKPWSLCDRHCWQSLLMGRKTSRPSPGILTMMAFPQFTV